MQYEKLFPISDMANMETRLAKLEDEYVQIQKNQNRKAILENMIYFQKYWLSYSSLEYIIVISGFLLCSSQKFITCCVSSMASRSEVRYALPY